MCNRREVEQCPIQVAIDEMCQRVRELKQTVSVQPTDVKKLQLRLQVSIVIHFYLFFQLLIVFYYRCIDYHQKLRTILFLNAMIVTFRLKLQI